MCVYMCARACVYQTGSWLVTHTCTSHVTSHNPQLDLGGFATLDPVVLLLSSGGNLACYCDWEWL